MPLTEIDLRGVYDSQPTEQQFVVDRIVAHYDIWELEDRGVEIARLKYVLTFPSTRPQTLR
jgi:hypothetical protein